MLEALERYSLIRKKDGAYDIHRVLQQLMRDRLAEPQHWLTIACNLVNRAFPNDSDEPKFWRQSESLLPHARAIRSHIKEPAEPESFSRLLNQAALYLRARGLYTEARDLQELALASALRRNKPDDGQIATYRSNLANVLHDFDELPEARMHAELALASVLKNLGPDHPHVAIFRTNLAAILQDLGELPEARRHQELALESDIKNFGPDHPHVAILRSNLTTILQDLGELSEARTQIELAVESNLKNLVPDHPNTAICRANLAAILHELGDTPAALREIDLALEIFRKVLTPDAPYIRTAEGYRRIILGEE